MGTIDTGTFLRGMEKSGGVCGRAVNTSNTGSGGVCASSLAHCVVSLDKELYSTLSLLTPGQVHKWVPVTYC